MQETDKISSCIISMTDFKTKHFPLSECLINKESLRTIYYLSVKVKKRKKNSENNPAVKLFGCASWFHFSFEHCIRHFYHQFD